MRKRLILMCILLVLLVTILFFEIRSICPLITYVEEVFCGVVPTVKTDNTPLALYNYFNRIKSSYSVKCRIWPIFALHDFEKGYVWIRYEYWVYNEEGVLQWGFSNRFPMAPSRWTIEKQDGEWKIVEIKEAV